MRRCYVRLLGVGLLSVLFFLALCSVVFGQEPRKRVQDMTAEDIHQLSYDELLSMDIEDLLVLAEKIGTSIDQLIELALNRASSLASRRSESVFASPLATYVISREDIELSGYTTIPELFNMVPGAIVSQKTNGNFDVTLRGMDNMPPQHTTISSENSTLLLMLDNRVVYSSLSGGTFWETLPISIHDIERIDIVRGGASALYGPNAVMGVINIITRKHVTEPNAVATVSYGMLDTRFATFESSTPLGKGWSARANLHLHQGDRSQVDYYSYIARKRYPSSELRGYFQELVFVAKPENQVPHSSMFRYGGNASLHYKSAEDVDIRLAVGMQQSDVQTLSYDNHVTPISRRFSRSAYVDARFQHGEFWAQSNYEQGMIDLARGYRMTIRPQFDYRLFGSGAGADFNVGDFIVQPEVSFRYASYNDLPYIDSARGEHGYFAAARDMSLVALGFRIEYRPLESLRFIAGARSDVYAPIRRTALSFQLVTTWQPHPHHLLRANFSTASRGMFLAPVYANVHEVPVSSAGFHVEQFGLLSPYHQMDIDPSTPIYFMTIEGNPRVRAPHLDNYEFGYRWMMHERYQVDLEGFYNLMRDFESPRNMSIRSGQSKGTSIGLVDYRKFLNLRMEAEQFGGTVSFTAVPLKALSVRLHATVQRTMLEGYLVVDGNRAVTTEDGEVEYLTKRVDLEHTWTPKFFGGLSLVYSPLRSRRLNFYADILYRSDRIYTYPVFMKGQQHLQFDALPAQLVANLSVSYRLAENLSIYLSGHNLGRRHRQYGFGDEVQPTVMGGIRFGL